MGVASLVEMRCYPSPRRCRATPRPFEGEGPGERATATRCGTSRPINVFGKFLVGKVVGKVRLLKYIHPQYMIRWLGSGWASEACEKHMCSAPYNDPETTVYVIDGQEAA